jgi:hypothetical protein
MVFNFFEPIVCIRLEIASLAEPCGHARRRTVLRRRLAWPPVGVDCVGVVGVSSRISANRQGIYDMR